MKKRLSLLFLPLILFSCGLKDARPADVASEDTMTSLFIDIHLAEARIGRTIHHYDSSRMAYRVVHQKILKKHNLTDSTYKHSYEYYVSKPELMDKIYERVLDSLSLKEAKLTSKDSIQTPQAIPTTQTLRPSN